LFPQNGALSVSSTGMRAVAFNCRGLVATSMLRIQAGVLGVFPSLLSPGQSAAWYSGVSAQLDTQLDAVYRRVTAG
jgi:hypothetical protein